MDPAEIYWLRRTLRRGDTVVDVGAYKGGYTYWMRRAVGGGGAVVAFEPQASAASMLRRYAAAFRWTNVRVVECALSSSVGTRELLTPGDGVSPAASLVGASLPPGPTARRVTVDTLDRQLSSHPAPSRIGLLKVDVEGHELDVFLGARETLEAHRPAILVECEARHLRGATMADVFSHLSSLGYHGSFFLGGALVDVARFDASTHQMEGRRPYVNNFVFIPADRGR